MQLSSPIVGTNFRPIDAQTRKANLVEGENLNLVRAPDNPFDSNAIEVHTEDGHFIGFIPKNINTDLAAALDAGASHVALWHTDTQRLAISTDPAAE